MTAGEILYGLSVVAQWIGALAIVWFVLFIRRQVNRFRDNEFLNTIGDDRFEFPQDLRADETPLAGRYVRYWILNHQSPMKYDEYSKRSHRVQCAILEVLMAYDRVVYDIDLGLSKKTVVKYQGYEFKKLWTVMEPVIMQLRKDSNGIPAFCTNLQRFVNSKQFERLTARYSVAQSRHSID